MKLSIQETDSRQVFSKSIKQNKVTGRNYIYNLLQHTVQQSDHFVNFQLSDMYYYLQYSSVKIYNGNAGVIYRTLTDVNKKINVLTHLFRTEIEDKKVPNITRRNFVYKSIAFSQQKSNGL